MPMLLVAYVGLLVAVAVYRAVFLPDPVFVFSPVWDSVVARFRALLSPSCKISMRSRLFLLFRLSLVMYNQTISLLLWTLDDIVFAGYRAMKLDNAMFVVGGFRTGSTSLHRSLALDERFISPRLLELAFPFFTTYKLLDLLEAIDRTTGYPLCDRIEKYLQSTMGEDILARHPMSYWDAEEDDALLSANTWAGWYTVTLIPDYRAWMVTGNIKKMKPATQQRLLTFYTRVIQKIMYRRGPDKILLAKSHLIDMMPLYEANLKSPKFVCIARHPKSSMPSWYALAQAAANVLALGATMPQDEATAAHLEFWDHYFESEAEFFAKSKSESSSSSSAAPKDVVLFQDYIKDQTGTVQRLYESWGLEFTDQVATALQKAEEDHKSYKNTHKYTNPTLEELNLSQEFLEQRYRDYMLAMGLLNE